MSNEWKLVPVDPTEEMLQCCQCPAGEFGEDEYRAMLDAAPVPPFRVTVHADLVDDGSDQSSRLQAAVDFASGLSTPVPQQAAFNQVPESDPTVTLIPTETWVLRTQDEIRAFKPPKFSMQFNQNGRVAGSIKELDDGTLHFEGDVAESAAIFMQYICDNYRPMTIKEMKGGVGEVERLTAECDALQKQLNERDEKLDMLESIVKHREEMLSKVAEGWPLKIYTQENPLRIKTCGAVMSYSVDHNGPMITTFDPDKMVFLDGSKYSEQPSSFTAIDMATASADGFSDGAASVVVELPKNGIIKITQPIDVLSGATIDGSNPSQLTIWNACIAECSAAIIAAGGSVK